MGDKLNNSEVTCVCVSHVDLGLKITAVVVIYSCFYFSFNTLFK